MNLKTRDAKLEKLLAATDKYRAARESRNPQYEGLTGSERDALEEIVAFVVLQHPEMLRHLRLNVTYVSASDWRNS